MANQYAEWRDQAEKMARGAGQILLRHFGQPLRVEYKGVINLVTQADKESEEFLVASLTEAFPDHSVLAEEGGGSNLLRPYRWLVDPLDGTTNFAHNYPFFCVSMALEAAEDGSAAESGSAAENGSRGPIVSAVVYDPIRDECWTAARGEGARLNNTPIRVSSVDRMDRALVATGFPYDVHEKPSESLKVFGSFLPITQAIRRDGSAALNLCYLACGRFDAFWEIRLHAWDTAAGSLIIQEAGGRVSDFRGGPYDPFGPECAASNTLLHEQLLGTLRGHPRPAPLPQAPPDPRESR